MLRIAAVLATLAVLVASVLNVLSLDQVTDILRPDSTPLQVIHDRYGAYRLFLQEFAASVFTLWLLYATWPRRRRGATRWWTPVVTVSCVVLFFAVVEVTARHYDSIPFGDGQFVADPVLGWRNAPGNGVNEDGMRNPAVPLQPEPDELRILCMGDSCTYGFFLRAEDTYPARLQAELQARLPGRKVKVLNAGTPGYGSPQGVVLLREQLRFQPDLVVWSFANNDVLAKPFQPPPDVGLPILDAIRRSHSYGFLRIELLHHLARPAGGVGSESTRSPRQFLEQAKEAATAAGATLCLLHFPDADLDSPVDLPMAAPPRRPEELTMKPGWRSDYAQAALDLGVPVINPMEAFRKVPSMEDLFVPDHYHLNAAGARLLAAEAARQLVEQDLVKSRGAGGGRAAGSE